jgi:hypothetical protein
MIEWKSFMAGPMILAMFLVVTLATASALRAQDSEAVTDSLVLVLNIISQTHARPATGVVLARRAPGGAALVAVPADFVSAGDEIVALDGGTDIERNGRPSRTVARSVQAGVALLEVEGLQRKGVELSYGDWPPDSPRQWQFAAWPAAEALAGGAPLIRLDVRIEPGPAASQLAATPALPDVSGPLFDGCGRLAGFHLSGGDGRLLGVGGLATLAMSVEMDVVQTPCDPVAESVPPDSMEDEEAVEAGVVESDDGKGAETELRSEVPDANGQTDGPVNWWLALVLLGLAGVVLYVLGSNKNAGNRIMLEPTGTGGRSRRCEVRFGDGSGPVRLERGDHTLEFRLEGTRATMTHLEGEDSNLVALALDGTPCLPGEVFVLNEGQQLVLGEEQFLVRMELAGDGKTKGP